MSRQTLDPGEWGPFEELAAAAAEIERLRSLLRWKGVDPDDSALVPSGHLLYRPERADEQRGRDHRTVVVQHGELAAEIDEQVAPLVAELWRAGLHTVNSCQDNPRGFVWLEFASLPDARRFVELVLRPADAHETDLYSLYRRVFHTGPAAFWPLRRGLWLYKLLPQNLAEPHAIEADFLLSVRFPHSDLPLVLERLREHRPEQRQE